MSVSAASDTTKPSTAARGRCCPSGSTCQISPVLVPTISVASNQVMDVIWRSSGSSTDRLCRYPWPACRTRMPWRSVRRTARSPLVGAAMVSVPPRAGGCTGTAATGSVAAVADRPQGASACADDDLIADARDDAALEVGDGVVVRRPVGVVEWFGPGGDSVADMAQHPQRSLVTAARFEYRWFQRESGGAGGLSGPDHAAVEQRCAGVEVEQVGRSALSVPDRDRWIGSSIPTRRSRPLRTARRLGRCVRCVHRDSSVCRRTPKRSGYRSPDSSRYSSIPTSVTRYQLSRPRARRARGARGRGR
jgi:hypothetical protein